ncbi:hypothetical protein FNY09_25065 [Salmonella enterica]|nr:hypothetical protein [Salmonella enterica]EEJ1867540.1 TraM recognition domain-containing protein [Salmonella enterica subsp. enterica serovar Gaminara]EEH8522177.1 TraM recognition domain-containing protein [Salmonella enterica]EID4755002.1 TraM recognition domain-containing protein [Salmonella enterica]EJZ1571030.1 TraM recognition domain-containing protein [Salmonella enterica]
MTTPQISDFNLRLAGLNNRRALVMDKMFSKMLRHNIQTVTVTQNLNDLKNIGNETVNAIIENCTAYIYLGNCNDKNFLDGRNVKKQNEED